MLKDPLTALDAYPVRLGTLTDTVLSNEHTRYSVKTKTPWNIDLYDNNCEVSLSKPAEHSKKLRHDPNERCASYLRNQIDPKG